jgi:hypothetical protein
MSCVTHSSAIKERSLLYITGEGKGVPVLNEALGPEGKGWGGAIAVYILNLSARRAHVSYIP